LKKVSYNAIYLKSNVMNEPQKDVTILLNAVSAGEESAPEKLLEAVYGDLRRLAAKYMRNKRDDHTLQATALVHEAFIRLVDWENVSWQNRAFFCGCRAGDEKNSG